MPNLGYGDSATKRDSERHIQSDQPCSHEMQPPFSEKLGTNPVEAVQYSYHHQYQHKTSGSPSHNHHSSFDKCDEINFFEARESYSNNRCAPLPLPDIGIQNDVDQLSVNLQHKSQSIDLSDYDPASTFQVEAKTSKFPAFPTPSSLVANTLTQAEALSKQNEESFDPCHNTLSTSLCSIRDYGTNAHASDQPRYEDTQNSFTSTNSGFQIEHDDSSKNYLSHEFSEKGSQITSNNSEIINRKERLASLHKHSHEELKHLQERDQAELSESSGSRKENNTIRFFNEGIEVSINGMPLSTKTSSDRINQLAGTEQKTVRNLSSTLQTDVNSQEDKSTAKDRSNRKEELDTLRLYQKSFWQLFASETDEER